jgi:hypothetical protein
LFIPQNHSIGERIVVRYFSGGTTEAWCCGRKRTNILNPNVSWCACRKRRKFILMRMDYEQCVQGLYTSFVGPFSLFSLEMTKYLIGPIIFSTKLK